MDDQGSELARMAILEAIETQIEEGDPPETAQTLQRLMSAGESREEALRLIGCVMADEMFHIMKHKRVFDLARYTRMLGRLPRMPWD